MFDLFSGQDTDVREAVGPRAYVLRGLALPVADELMQAMDRVATTSPLRHMSTPGGLMMAVATTNCGELGWISDSRGYRYTGIDPDTRLPWPTMPDVLQRLAGEAANATDFPGFEPDACLINRYVPGTRLSLHQDKDERDFNAPIVSVSLGMSATFLFGGYERSARTVRVALHHGDVLVWGGEDRLRFHGVMPLKGVAHPQLGEQRINFTLRKAA